MPITGEAKRKWQREYMRVKRARARGETPVKEMTRPEREAVVLKALISGNRATVDRALEQTGITRQELTRQLTEAGLPIMRILRKFAEKLDAKKSLVSRGSHGVDTIESDDNDAQLRAAEGALRLHERAGTIPIAPEGSQGGSHITVNMIRFTGTMSNSQGKVRTVPRIVAPTGEVEQTVSLNPESPARTIDP